MSFVKRQIENRKYSGTHGRYGNTHDLLLELHAYEEGWTKAMPIYWREKLLSLGVYDTGKLYRSLTGSINVNHTEIMHKFLEYGIYVEAGTGKEFTKGSEGRNAQGQLKILDDSYREEHGLNKRRKVKGKWVGGHPREKKPWFALKYYSSVMRLSEFEANYYGEAYNGLLSTALQDIFGNTGIVRNLL